MSWIFLNIQAQVEFGFSRNSNFIFPAGNKCYFQFNSFTFTGGANGKSRLYYSRYQPPLADAHVDCQHVGGHLVKIDGPEEYDLIINN